MSAAYLRKLTPAVGFHKDFFLNELGCFVGRIEKSE
jgi:hypothetical protein